MHHLSSGGFDGRFTLSLDHSDEGSQPASQRLRQARQREELHDPRLTGRRPQATDEVMPGQRAMAAVQSQLADPTVSFRKHAVEHLLRQANLAAMLTDRPRNCLQKVGCARRSGAQLPGESERAGDFGARTVRFIEAG